MVRVDIGEAVAYGIHLISYTCGLAIVGGIAIAIAASSFQAENYLFTLIAGMLGAVVVLGGILGLSYKVIADGVSTGLQKAE